MYGQYSRAGYDGRRTEPTFEYIKETLAKLYRKDLCRSFTEVFGQTIPTKKDI